MGAVATESGRLGAARRHAGAARARLTGGGWLLLACLVLAALPIVVGAVQELVAGWIPFSDDAAIATRAHDVFTGESPLIGNYSQASRSAGAPTYGLGPLVYWLLAVPVRIGPWAMIVTVAAVNVACACGIVALARRCGGTLLMVAVTLGLVLVARSLPSQVLHDIWTPAIALLPLTLLVFVCWSIALGEARLLPLGALIAGFVAHAHMTYITPAAAAMAVALVGLGAYWLRPSGRRRRPLEVRDRDRAERRRLRRSLLVTAGVLVVSWFPPVLDAVLDAGGNLRRVAAGILAGDAPTLGLETGWNTLVHAVSPMPWWTRTYPGDAGLRWQEIVWQPPGAVASLVTAGLLVAVLGVGVVALRRRRSHVAVGSALALGLCAALVFTVSSLPETGLFAVGYVTWWASPAGMIVWVMLGWGLWTLAGERLALPRSVRRAALGIALVAVLAATAIAVTAAGRSTDMHDGTEPLEGVRERLDATLADGRSYMVDGPRDSIALQTGVVHQVRLLGFDVRTFPAQAVAFGPEYDAVRHPVDGGVIRVDLGTAGARPGGTLIARRWVPSAGRWMTVSLRPAGRAPRGS